MPMRPLAGILAASSIAGLATAVLPLTGLLSIVALAIDCVVFTLVYLTVLPLVWGIDGNDIIRLSIAGETMGPAGTLLNVTLAYERRMLALARRA